MIWKCQQKTNIYEILYLFAAQYSICCCHFRASFRIFNVYYNFTLFYILLIKRNINRNGIEPFVGSEPIFERERGERGDEQRNRLCNKNGENMVDYRKFCECLNQSWLVLMQCIASWSAFYDFQFFHIDFWTFRHIATNFWAKDASQWLSKRIRSKERMTKSKSKTNILIKWEKCTKRFWISTIRCNKNDSPIDGCALTTAGKQTTIKQNLWKKSKWLHRINSIKLFRFLEIIFKHIPYSHSHWWLIFFASSSFSLLSFPSSVVQPSVILISLWSVCRVQHTEKIALFLFLLNHWKYRSAQSSPS